MPFDFQDSFDFLQTTSDDGTDEYAEDVLFAEAARLQSGDRSQSTAQREQNLVNNLSAAIRSADTAAIQDLIETLNRNPNSVDSVLGTLRGRILNSDVRLNWERGLRNGSEPFVSLEMSYNGRLIDGQVRFRTGTEPTFSLYAHSDGITNGWELRDAMSYIAEHIPERKLRGR